MNLLQMRASYDFPVRSRVVKRRNDEPETGRRRLDRRQPCTVARAFNAQRVYARSGMLDKAALTMEA